MSARDHEEAYVARFADERYRSETDEFGPFGTDAGGDVWLDWEHRGAELVGDRATVRHVLAATWGLDEQDLDLADFGNVDEGNFDQLEALIGSGFALVRLTGGIDPDGLGHVMRAIGRAWEITGESWFATMSHDLAKEFGVVSTLPLPAPESAVEPAVESAPPVLVEEGYLTDDLVLPDRPVVGDPESWYRSQFPGEAFVSVDPEGPGPFQTETGRRVWQRWAGRAAELPTDASVRHVVAGVWGGDPGAIDLRWHMQWESAEDGLIAACFALVRLRGSIDVETFGWLKRFIDPQSYSYLPLEPRARPVVLLREAVQNVFGRAWVAYDRQFSSGVWERRLKPWLTVSRMEAMCDWDEEEYEQYEAEDYGGPATVAATELQYQLQTWGDLTYQRLLVTPWSVWAAETLGPDVTLNMTIHLWETGLDPEKEYEGDVDDDWSDLIVHGRYDRTMDAHQVLGQFQTCVTDGLRSHLTQLGITSPFPAWPADTPWLDVIREARRIKASSDRDDPDHD